MDRFVKIDLREINGSFTLNFHYRPYEKETVEETLKTLSTFGVNISKFSLWDCDFYHLIQIDLDNADDVIMVKLGIL